jgi:hypothetical protein
MEKYKTERNGQNHRIMYIKMQRRQGGSGPGCQFHEFHVFTFCIFSKYPVNSFTPHPI